MVLFCHYYNIIWYLGYICYTNENGATALKTKRNININVSEAVWTSGQFNTHVKQHNNMLFTSKQHNNMLFTRIIL